MRGGAIDANHTAAALPLDGVGRKAGAARHVPDMHLFEFGDVRRIHEIAVDGQASFVVEVRLSDGRAMDFSAEEGSHPNLQEEVPVPLQKAKASLRTRSSRGVQACFAIIYGERSVKQD